MLQTFWHFMWHIMWSGQGPGPGVFRFRLRFKIQRYRKITQTLQQRASLFQIAALQQTGLPPSLLQCVSSAASLPVFAFALGDDLHFALAVTFAFAAVRFGVGAGGFFALAFALQLGAAGDAGVLLVLPLPCSSFLCDSAAACFSTSPRSLPAPDPSVLPLM